MILADASASIEYDRPTGSAVDGHVQGTRDLAHACATELAGSFVAVHGRLYVCEDRSMIDVDLPDTDDVPELVRSFATCVASVSETPVGSVAQPRADLSEAVAH